MFNPYQPKQAKIIKIRDEAPNIKLFRLKPAAKFFYQPGQIIAVSYPGYGEAPFAPCGKLGENYLEVCVRKVGRLTEKLHSLKVGDLVNFRGPYGNGVWPVANAQVKSSKLKISARGGSALGGKNYLIVVGGLGLVPLRTLLLDKNKFLGKNAKVQLLYGARTPQDFIFSQDLKKWRDQGIDVHLTIDKECPGWKECVGVVTVLFDKVKIVENALAYLCGPPIMYRFVLEKLKAKGLSDSDIYLSLERRMHCGVGVCQHCAIGTKYVCHQGPVFRYDEIKNIAEVI
ncbi:MAG: FAD/NAD(P)-binding protein [bacterium]